MSPNCDTWIQYPSYVYPIYLSLLSYWCCSLSEHLHMPFKPRINIRLNLTNCHDCVVLIFVPTIIEYIIVVVKYLGNKSLITVIQCVFLNFTHRKLKISLSSMLFVSQRFISKHKNTKIYSIFYDRVCCSVCL